MKKIILLLCMAQTVLSQNSIIQSLDTGWRVKPTQAIKPPKPDDMGQAIDANGYDTKLPNSVINTLYQHKVIEDPHYRDHEIRLRWLENTDWSFSNTFKIDNIFLKKEKIELQLRGVDTYADIYLNDSLILKTDNAFRTWLLDVKPLLRLGENTLRVQFTAPPKIEKQKLKASPIDFPDVYGTTRAYTRKPQFHYGWDWGPRFVTCGIQSAALTAWDVARLTDVFMRQDTITAERAVLKAFATVEATAARPVFVNIAIGDHIFSEQLTTQVGVNQVVFDISLDTPQLWWTRALGKPHLYAVRATLTMPSVGATTEGVVLDEKKFKIGLRDVKLMTERDDKGSTFYFKLNNTPVFIKGANYIPQSLFQERITRQDYERIIKSADKANMNMLRVWGGGIYEAEAFYDLCDEAGILVWQDFMYACAMYPGDEAFLQNAKAEAIEQVIRLRNHASIALWCGNNEINEAWHNWGWQPRFNPDQKEYIWNAYKRLFMDILPNVVQQFSNNTSYWESSPSYSRYDKRSYTEGDNHDWFVWHDEKPFEHFEEKVPRFMSEYGFQSFPDWKTIETFTLPEERQLESKVMLLHQKHARGNQLIRRYMERDYNLPFDFENFVYVSQVLQAEGIGKAIEAQRRAKPYCMGTLYWQLNDVWQVASWSSIDNFGRWKALHYKAKEVYADVIISPFLEKDVWKVAVVNDKLGLLKGVLHIRILDFKGQMLFDKKLDIDIKGNSSQSYFSMDIKNVFKNEAEKKNSFAHITLIIKDLNSIEKTFYFVKPKDLNLDIGKIAREVQPTEGGVLIKIHAPILLKNVFMSSPTEGQFEENYFDLLPNVEKTIFYKTNESAKHIFETLRIKSLVNTY